jgi:hypothetical protein
VRLCGHGGARELSCGRSGSVRLFFSLRYCDPVPAFRVFFLTFVKFNHTKYYYKYRYVRFYQRARACSLDASFKGSVTNERPCLCAIWKIADVPKLDGVPAAKTDPFAGISIAHRKHLVTLCETSTILVCCYGLSSLFVIYICKYNALENSLL